MKTKNKALISTLAISLLLSSNLPINANAAMQQEGLATTSKQALAIQKASSDPLVPLRKIAEELGAQIQWDPVASTVTVIRLNHVFSIQLGTNKATLEGKPYRLSSIPQVLEGHIYVPLSFLNEGLGTAISWDKQSNQMLLSKTNIAEKAAVFVTAVLNGTSADPSLYFSSILKSLVPAKSIAPNFAALKAALGGYKGILDSTEEKNLVHDNITFTLAFTNAALPFIVRFNHEGEIDDFVLDQNVKTAGYVLPQYANEKRYTEQEIVVGSGQWALPGTLSLPNEQKLHPAVILVHGSGPGDRDEALYALKPFRDLSSGLASQGIAVLRYEKRTREYPAQFSASPNTTIKEEAEDDVLAAIELLRTTKGVDPKQIYVLGHSQGGFMMPRLLELDKAKQIAGSILMSAPAGTFYDIFEKQITDQVNLKQVPPDALDYYKAQFAMIRANELPPKEFALTPRAWWFDLRGYEPSQQAKTQTGKLLILQGARDFQVTSDNLDTWRLDLKERKDVTYHLYPKLNHFYTEGEGDLSTVQEYTKPGNIPDYVINDIVTWINTPIY